MILALLLHVSLIATQFTFIGIITRGYHFLAWKKKNSLKHMYLPNRKAYINWDKIRRYHCIAWKTIICNICMYQPETGTFIVIILEDIIALHGKMFAWFVYTYQKLIHLWGCECFPLCTTWNSPMHWKILTITLGCFINYCTVINIISTQIWFITHTQTRTHHWRFHFHLWAFVSETSLAISIVWNI